MTAWIYNLLIALIQFQCFALIVCDSEADSSSTADILDEARIIGGDSVLDGDLRYQLSLRYRNFHHCGASLAEVGDTQIAITAAHCSENYDKDQFSVVAGDVRLSDRSGREQERKVVKIVNHESYDPETISFDISILFFDTPFVVNDFVGPIPLPEQEQETKGSLIVSGWGVYNYQGYYNDNLTKLEVPVVDDELCREAYEPLEYEYFDHYLCAGYLGIGVFKDSCKGDSGGPLRSKENGYLAGVVSWSEGCAHPRFPGVNTEVSYFIDWINEEVSKYTPEKKEVDRKRPVIPVSAVTPASPLGPGVVIEAKKKIKSSPAKNNSTSEWYYQTRPRPR